MAENPVKAAVSMAASDAARLPNSHWQSILPRLVLICYWTPGFLCLSMLYAQVLRSLFCLLSFCPGIYSDSSQLKLVKHEASQHMKWTSSLTLSSLYQVHLESILLFLSSFLRKKSWLFCFFKAVHRIHYLHIYKNVWNILYIYHCACIRFVV